MTPFRSEIPQAALDDLRRRLENTRRPTQVPDVGWSRGVPVSWLDELLAQWTSSCDWRATEARLNSYPQFTTEIDGQTIHFLHVRSRHESASPLILLHGWPGSVLEFLDVIEPLTEDFHLVIPSHPNFGLTGPARAGWDSHRIATAYASLMASLGYSRYFAQGGDFGAIIAPDLGRVDAAHVAAVHVNAATLGFIPLDSPEGDFSEDEKVRLERLQAFIVEWNQVAHPFKWSTKSVAKVMAKCQLTEVPSGDNHAVAA